MARLKDGHPDEYIVSDMDLVVLQAIKALTAALAPKARAIRDGTLQQIDAALLVPGDVVLISIGNIVPADLKLLGEEGDDVPMQVWQ